MLVTELEKRRRRLLDNLAASLGSLTALPERARLKDDVRCRWGGGLTLPSLGLGWQSQSAFENLVLLSGLHLGQPQQRGSDEERALLGLNVAVESPEFLVVFLALQV